MSTQLLKTTLEIEKPEPPDVSHLITEDDTPVDNLFSEKQQRLLTRPLYITWMKPGAEHKFVVAANVGIYYSLHKPAIMPDVFLSLDVEMPENWWETAGRSYLVWEMGKPPDVAIEIVSNRKGGKKSNKLRDYANARIGYYVVFDPNSQIQDNALTIYRLAGNQYVETDQDWMEEIQLGLKLWTGEFEGRRATWLRWCDKDGQVLLTGQETADKERNRAERLAAQLRAAGIEPEV